VIQRGNNKEAVFFEEEDYVKYKTILHEVATKQGLLATGQASCGSNSDDASPYLIRCLKLIY